MGLDTGAEGGATELSDAQMDSLIEGSSESREIPMRSEPAAAATPQEFTIKVNGQDVKAPWEKIQTWAQQGYGYPQKMQEFNQQREAFTKREAELKELEGRLNPYREIDEYAAKNPEWWQQVQSQYQQKIQNATSSPEIAQLKNELAEFKQFMNSQQAKEKSVAMKSEDEQLSSEVDSLRKTYSNLDFDTPDEEGNNLEMRVLRHAMENDIKSFRIAFRDYMHDQLLSFEREKGKELVSKEVQKRTKLGILGESPKPTKGLRTAENVRDKSYDDLMREAIEELGVG